MARAKISQLDPKGADLSSTDLFEVSVNTGSGYDTYSITGQEIINGGSGVYVPYTGATQDVDLDANKLSAESIYIEGTNGNGHLHLKHQNADATATGQSTALWANTDGDIKWKNDNDYKTTLKTSLNTADRVYTFPNTDCTLVPNGAITTSGLTMATSRLLGRTTALNGEVEEISIGTGLTLSGGTLSSTGGGITVGTTAVTSGTDTRVFFQQGGVIQQDANFTFNNTQKRLTLKAVGTAATDIPLIVQDSAATNNLFEFRGNGQLYNINNTSGISAVSTLTTTDNLSAPSLRVISTGGNSSATIAATRLAGSGVSATATNRGFVYLESLGGSHCVIGANDGIAFSAQGISSYNPTSDQMRLKNGNLAIGTGYSASARLDVKAQGALSTDIAFRVRNSADTVNLVRFNGDGTHFFFNSTGSTNINFYEYGHGIWANGGSSFRIKNLNGSTSIEGTTSTRFITDVTNKAITFDGRQLHIGGQSLPTINGDSCIIIESGTAPTTALSDRFYIYSADITAGNAAPHFRTENGNIIKLYRETTAVAAATFVANTSLIANDTATFDGYTIGQVVKALRNLGILA